MLKLALIRAIEEQIAFLQAELARLRSELEREEHSYMAPALADSGFQAFLLRRQLESQ